MSESKQKVILDSEEKNRIVGGMLYLVSTPIGNLSDLSERAIKVLSEVDFIAAEDTRNSMRLLTAFGISKPMISYFEHNKRERGPQIAERLMAGESCALVTDAGTPAISDPGEDLVAICAERGIPVTAIPGPVASIVALTLSGLPTVRFTFEGFLPMDRTERKKRLADLKAEQRTILLHEAPHKLKTTLSDLASTFGTDRRISLCRELTKRNEEIFRTTIGDAILFYEQNTPRGEYVLVVEGTSAKQLAEQANDWEELSISEHVLRYQNTGMSRNEAIKATARDRGVNKNTVYQEMIGK